MLRGHAPFPLQSLVRLIPVRRGDRLHTDALQRGAQHLQNTLQQRAYPFADVSWRLLEGSTREQVVVEYLVDAGPFGRLQEVHFRGNHVFSDLQLLNALRLRPSPHRWNPFSRQGTLFLPQYIEKDREAIEYLYQRHGYARAAVDAARVAPTSDTQGFQITWTILNEGPLFRIGYIGIDTDIGLSRAWLESHLSFQSGDIFNIEQVRAARIRMQADLLQRGHAFAVVRADSETHIDTERIDLVFTIDAATRPSLHKIHIDGLQATSPLIVEREIPFRAGDGFDARALQEAEARLRAMQIFSSVDMWVERLPDPNLYDLRIDVRERATGRIEAGVIYGEVEGAAFQFLVREWNFAPRPPYRGDGLLADLNLTLGSEIVQAELGLHNPRIGHTYWSMGGRATYEDNTFISPHYNQKSQNHLITLGHPLGDNQFASVGYAYTTYQIYDIAEDVFEDPESLREKTTFTALTLSWDRDGRDHHTFPRRGWRADAGIQMGHRALGGNTDVILSRASTAVFFNPVRDHVLELRTRYRSAAQHGDTITVPPSMRLFLGGSSDLRGFAYRSVSPPEENGERLGGLSAWSATIEYRLPLNDRLFLAAYLDAGDVAETSYAIRGEGTVGNLGFGIQIQADNFPVRFDYAIPVRVYENDPENEKGKGLFSFSAGYRY